MWHHPKYYKELRKRNKSDQAISEDASTEATSVRPGPGQSSKRQAATGPGASCKLQASEDSTANSTRGQVAEPEAASCKHQASSLKHQAVQKK